MDAVNRTKHSLPSTAMSVSSKIVKSTGVIDLPAHTKDVKPKSIFSKLLDSMPQVTKLDQIGFNRDSDGYLMCD